jgi:hypothetical protein
VASLKKALESQVPRWGGSQCVVCQVVSLLPPEDVEALTAALESRRMSAPMICRALQESGYDVSAGSLRRHRRGECVAPVVGL